MKTAILVVGHVRTWSECKNNFIDAFQHLVPDVFVSTYDLQYNYHPAQQKWMMNELDSYLSVNQIQSLFSGVNLIGLDVESINEVLTEYQLNRNTIHNNFQDEMHTYLQCRKIKRAVELMKESEIRQSIKYDAIIKIRADIHHNIFTHDIKDTNVIISDGNVFPNDVIIAASRDNFIKISEFIMSEFFQPTFYDSHLKAPHNLFLRAFEHVGVKIEEKHIMNYVIRKTGIQYYDKIK